MFEAKGEDEFDRGLERALGPVVSEAGPSTGPSQSEIFHDRWDLTKELMRTPDAHRWKRRLDSIARLIEANSVCAAIAIKDGSFLIATNYDLTAESDTEGLRLIETVMNFFKKVSESGVINDSEGYKKAFYETFKAICLGAMGGLQIPAATKARLSDDDFLESVVARRAVLDGLQGKQRQKKLRTFRDYISEHSEIGHYPADQAAAYYVCTALLLDFEKVIKFIDQYKDLSDISAEANFITAIKGYTKDNVITREKLTGKISATGDKN